MMLDEEQDHGLYANLYRDSGKTLSLAFRACAMVPEHVVAHQSAQTVQLVDLTETFITYVWRLSPPPPTHPPTRPLTYSLTQSLTHSHLVLLPPPSETYSS